MRIVTWNINGIRAAAKKGFLQWLEKEQPEILCVQEIKATPDQLDPSLLQPPGYHVYWNPAQRKGYSGVATFCRVKPLRVEMGMGVKRFDIEGRVLMTEHPKFLLFNVYFPNGTMGDHRVEYKLDFYDAFLDYCEELRAKGHELIICGDFNTAHQEIDIARPKENEKNSGFLPKERAKIDEWLAKGWIDIFRTFDKRPAQYTWWSFRSNARARNVGWRIDYHLITPGLVKRCRGAGVSMDVKGSDHCPATLEIAD